MLHFTNNRMWGFSYWGTPFYGNLHVDSKWSAPSIDPLVSEGVGATESALETPAGADAVPWLSRGYRGKPRKNGGLDLETSTIKCYLNVEFCSHVRLPQGNVSLQPMHWYAFVVENIWLVWLTCNGQDIWVWYPWLLFAKHDSKSIELVFLLSSSFTLQMKTTLGKQVADGQALGLQKQSSNHDGSLNIGFALPKCSMVLVFTHKAGSCLKTFVNIPWSIGDWLYPLAWHYVYLNPKFGIPGWYFGPKIPPKKCGWPTLWAGNQGRHWQQVVNRHRRRFGSS